MQQVIIIPTTKKYEPWLIDFIKSYNHKYPLMLVYGDNNKFDAKGVIAGIKGQYDEFLVLHDTLEIKDNSFFDLVFETYKSESVELVPHNTMFMIKYTKKHLEMLPPQAIFNLMEIHDKWSAVIQEAQFSRIYEHYAMPIVLFPNIDKGDKNPHEYKYGRDNMILENEYIKKYKGSWNVPTLQKADKYVPRIE